MDRDVIDVTSSDLYPYCHISNSIGLPMNHAKCLVVVRTGIAVCLAVVVKLLKFTGKVCIATTNQ